MKVNHIITIFLLEILLILTYSDVSNGHCTKEEIVKLINAGYSKKDIDTICIDNQKNEKQADDSGDIKASTNPENDYKANSLENSTTCGHPKNDISTAEPIQQGNLQDDSLDCSMCQSGIKLRATMSLYMRNIQLHILDSNNRLTNFEVIGYYIKYATGTGCSNDGCPLIYVPPFTSDTIQSIDVKNFNSAVATGTIKLTDKTGVIAGLIMVYPPSTYSRGGNYIINNMWISYQYSTDGINWIDSQTKKNNFSDHYDPGCKFDKNK